MDATKFLLTVIKKILYNSCDDNLGCENTQIDCDDYSECTTDTCCSDGCQYADVVCNDYNACTEDSCDDETGCVTLILALNVKLKTNVILTIVIL